MKPHIQFFRKTVPALLAAGLCAASPAQADKTNSAAKSPAGATATNKPVAMVEIPKSVFVQPTDPAEGKDPFFPRSMYPYTRGATVVATNKTSTLPAVPVLVLNGISGTPENPLAIINNVTFGVGDMRDIFLPGGRRFPVLCQEINLKTGTAVVQAAGQRQTLHLKR